MAPNVILSAAHCASITGPAVLGLHTKTVDGAEEFENIEIIPFANSVTHPQYNGGTLDNDYWVIQLAHDSQLYQDRIVELDSPTDSFDLTAGQDVTVIGMGTTSSGGGLPNTLQEVTVDYITNEACCTGDYQYSCTQLTANMMCAARVGQDSCQGDSGGPIFDTATQKQVGIVSWGYSCADPSYPGGKFHSSTMLEMYLPLSMILTSCSSFLIHHQSTAALAPNTTGSRERLILLTLRVQTLQHLSCLGLATVSLQLRSFIMDEIILPTLSRV